MWGPLPGETFFRVSLLGPREGKSTSTTQPYGARFMFEGPTPPSGVGFPVLHSQRVVRVVLLRNHYDPKTH